jgi:hypothetical protein
VGKNAGPWYPHVNFECSDIYQRLAPLMFVGFSVQNGIILDEGPFIGCIMGMYSRGDLR